MKLTGRKMLLISFMLFSLFFGAGNLIFPPFLGQNAGEQTWNAIAGFLITAVLLPVLGVIVVARFDGLDKLSGAVGAGGDGIVQTRGVYYADVLQLRPVHLDGDVFHQWGVGYIFTHIVV